MDVIDKIDKLRRERGWSVNNLALEAMLTQSTVNNLFNRRNEPKLNTLRAICDAFGITLAEFFAEEMSEEDELNYLVRRLDDDQKQALLTLLRGIK